MSTKDPFVTIESNQLETVSGGAMTVAAGSTDTDDQLTAMLQQISTSIAGLAQNNSGGGDQNEMMMMMMMMMGMGGGAAGAVAAPAAPTPTYVQVTSNGSCKG